MKKKLVLILSLIAILAVSACTAAGTTNGNATQTTTAGSDQLPTLSKLVVGTYKLIDSSTPVTQDQARELVVLWKAYKELNTRDSKAQQEVTDLLTQINSSLTTDQIAAIDAMNLSTRDVMSLVQELGVSASTASTSRTGSSSSSNSSAGGGPGGFPRWWNASGHRSRWWTGYGGWICSRWKYSCNSFSQYHCYNAGKTSRFWCSNGDNGTTSDRSAHYQTGNHCQPGIRL